MSNTRHKGTTNTRKGSVQEAQYACNLYWSQAHIFSLKRMSESIGDNKYDLLDCYQTRARRIAATYARFYLELEDGCDPSKKGRFYWMALGAFASKTVACLLDSWPVKGSFIGGILVEAISSEGDTSPPPPPTVNHQIYESTDVLKRQPEIQQVFTADDLLVISEGLGLGNLWLFLDVATWHWAYANHPEDYFQGMNCATQRNAQELLNAAEGHGIKKAITQDLEWAEYALSKINNLQSTGYIHEGMQLVTDIENSTSRRIKRGLQMDHLKAVANHEQLEILQKLIYNHPLFAKMVKLQREGVFNTALERSILSLLSPAYELVFASACSVDDPNLKSVAPKGVQLEVAGTLADAEQDNPKTRMGWIGKAAKKFHKLMQEKEQYMEREMSAIAGWVGEADFSETCISVHTVSNAFK